MSLFTSKQPAVQKRTIHIDFKGTPPTPKRLLELLDLFKSLRINAVLVEWEDAFPWKRHPHMKSPTAYSPAVIRAFLEKACELRIEVIPLVQCLGHSENLLQNPQLREMREIPDDCSELCPSHPGSVLLVMDLIDDILELSNGCIKRFHLGGDEAWRMGSCPKCKAAIKRDGKDQLYLRHVNPLLNYLADRALQPILWDDMMRKWPTAALKSLGRRANLMAWAYEANPVHPGSHLQESHLANFKRAGIRLWGASAYKGGDGAFCDLPDMAARNANNLVWARLAKKYGMLGVVATSWGRYNTFMSPCETIDASLDTLALAALIMWNGYVPRNPEKAAHAALLRAGEWKTFEKCHKAAKDLESWQKWDLKWTLELLERTPRLNGEPRRHNPGAWRATVVNTGKMMEKGRKAAAAFVKAHQGLVPRHWLDLYAKSRLMPIERRFRAIPRGPGK